MIRKLRLKFIAVTTALLTVMLCVIFGLIIHFTAQSLEAESIQALRTAASAPMRLGRPDETDRLSGFTVRITPMGTIVENSGSFDLSDEELLNKLIETAANSEEQIGELSEYSLRFCRDSGVGGMTIVFADITAEKAAIRNLTLNCIGIGLAALLALWGISVLLARWMIRPVEAAWQEQRQFVADASHELKTPLTVILTNAELLQSPDCDEVQKARFSESILVMSRQMRGLVEGLLELARADRGPDRAAVQRFDFSACMTRASLPFEPLFFERELTLESFIEPGLQLCGDEEKLRHLPEILLDNALKYARSPGQVILSLRRQGSHALLTVSNTGDPIPAAERKEIFKRFYRADKSRRCSGSYGLGLSIAESIVQAHGGKIWAESAGGWNRFVVQLPLG